MKRKKGRCVDCGRRRALLSQNRCPTCTSEANLRPKRTYIVGRSTLSGPYGKFVRDASKRGIVVTIDAAHYEAIVGQPCDYCGSTYSVGVDRFDAHSDYVHGNVGPCCTQCNMRKGQLTREQWMRVVGPARREYGDGNVWPKENPLLYRFDRKERAREARVLVLLFDSMRRWAESVHQPEPEVDVKSLEYDRDSHDAYVAHALAGTRMPPWLVAWRKRKVDPNSRGYRSLPFEMHEVVRVGTGVYSSMCRAREEVEYYQQHGSMRSSSKELPRPHWMLHRWRARLGDLPEEVAAIYRDAGIDLLKAETLKARADRANRAEWFRRAMVRLGSM